MHWVKAVSAIVGGIAAGPFHPHAADGNIGSAVHFQTVARGVFDGEVFQSEVASCDQHSFGADFLILPIEDGLIMPLTPDCDAIDIEGERAVERIDTSGDSDNIAWLCIDQLFLQRGLIFAVSLGQITRAVR